MIKQKLFNTPFRFAFIFLVILTYTLFFYFLSKLNFKLDFTSFYASAIAYKNHSDPYGAVIGNFLSANNEVSLNLNPPFFLELIKPLTLLNYNEALIVWSLSLFILGLVGAYFAFKLAITPAVFRKHWFCWLATYLALFSTLMNTTFAQIGGLLLFFIIIGYYFYLKKNDYVAGILWGTIISIKIFPALLFIFAWKEKRHRVLIIMIATCLVTYLIPIFTYGANIYQLYLNGLQHIRWYGDSWNASVYGFLSRLLTSAPNHNPNLWLVNLIYGATFICSLIWYARQLKHLNSSNNNQRSFCLTLVVMLFLSPLGWLYYFPLLIMPLTHLYESLNKHMSTKMTNTNLWVTSFLFINFPIGYLPARQMPPSILYKLTFFSLYFYGLLILAYLLSRPRIENATAFLELNPIKKNYLLFPAMLILYLGLIIPLLVFVAHLI